MSESYTKLFEGILDSSVWDEDDQTRLVWVTMLAMADQNGHVRAAVPGLARRARVSIENTEKALEKFKAPDKYSRNKEHEGRRIRETERGWVILNHPKFRENNASSAPPAPDKPGKVYFIQCGDAVKIGFSQNPWARLNALKATSPAVPVLLGHLNGLPEDEKRLQTRFEHLRLNSEWFRGTAEMLSVVAALVATGSATSDEGSELPDELPELQQEAEAEAEAINPDPPATQEGGAAAPPALGGAAPANDTVPKPPRKSDVAKAALSAAVKALAHEYDHDAPPTASKAHQAAGASKVAALIAGGTDPPVAAARVARAAYRLLAAGKASSFGWALNDCVIGAAADAQRQTGLRPGRLAPSPATTAKDFENAEPVEEQLARIRAGR